MIPVNPIVINADADFTPRGKRSVKVVRTSSGGSQIRGYVSGYRYMTFKNIEQAIKWRDNTQNLHPQSWETLL